jgi:2-dehydropantoate 2-reductase
MNQGLPFMEPLHILGSGAIGLLFAASIRMAFPSYPLTMLVRQHHEARLQPIDKSRKKYMEVSLQSTFAVASTANQRKRLAPPRLVRIPAQVVEADGNRGTAYGGIQNLLLTTKAPDAVPALRSILPRLASDDQPVRIIVLCNGALAVKDEVEQTLREDDAKRRVDLVLASTTHGAYRDDETMDGSADQVDDEDYLYHVVHAGVGKTFVENEPQLAQLLDQSGLTCTSISSRDMTILLWKKLAANCVINPLTALLRCSNGELPQHELYDEYHERIVEEIALVAETLQVETCNADDSTEQQHLSPSQLQAFVRQVIDDTASNKSSMLQDILHNRRTEVDYFNGYVERKGSMLGVDVSANRELCERVRALSRQQ